MDHCYICKKKPFLHILTLFLDVTILLLMYNHLFLLELCSQYSVLPMSVFLHSIEDSGLSLRLYLTLFNTKSSRDKIKC